MLLDYISAVKMNGTLWGIHAKWTILADPHLVNL
jgi:hypothetical protein